MNNQSEYILRQIRTGLRFFRPQGETIDDLRRFQLTVEALIEAEDHGFVLGVKPHRESETGEHLFDLVQVEGLTDLGETAIASTGRE